jgi:hypothetical protein
MKTRVESTRRFFAAVLLALVTGSATADVFDHPADVARLRSLLGPVAAQVREAQTLRGGYVQTKHLPELPQPLVATGDFLFVRGQGVRWRTVTPFASELVITPRGLTQRDAGSETRVDADKQPAVRLVGRIFLAVFSLDFDALAELFELSAAAPAAGRWSLGLKPRQNAGSLKSIEVDGGKEVERVVLREGAEDLTEIRLHDAVASPAPPAAADLAVFAR